MQIVKDDLVGLKNLLYTKLSIQELLTIIQNIEFKLKNPAINFGMDLNLTDTEKQIYLFFYELFKMVYNKAKENKMKGRIKIFALDNPFEKGRIYGNENYSKIRLKISEEDSKEEFEFVYDTKKSNQQGDKND